jgi:hypothetical protein
MGLGGEDDEVASHCQSIVLRTWNDSTPNALLLASSCSRLCWFRHRDSKDMSSEDSAARFRDEMAPLGGSHGQPTTAHLDHRHYDDSCVC